MIVFPTEHYQGLNEPSNLDLDLEKFLEIRRSNDDDDDDHEFINSLKFTHRIGSDSLHAKVYAGQLHDSRIAVKALKVASKLDSEVAINLLITEDQTNNRYFLYFIRGLLCDDGAFLIMEMAMCDVQQLLKYSTVFPLDIFLMIKEVLQSLLRLAQLGIYHGDLHLGNVFLVMRDGKRRTVIGDFGESSVTTSPTASSSDLFYFINALRQRCYQLEIITPLNNFFSALGWIASRSETDFDAYLIKNVTEKESAIRCNIEFIESATAEWYRILMLAGYEQM